MVWCYVGFPDMSLRPILSFSRGSRVGRRLPTVELSRAGCDTHFKMCPVPFSLCIIIGRRAQSRSPSGIRAFSNLPKVSISDHQTTYLTQLWSPTSSTPEDGVVSRSPLCSGLSAEAPPSSSARGRKRPIKRPGRSLSTAGHRLSRVRGRTKRWNDNKRR